MSEKPEKIVCPSCENISTYDEWYNVSNDYMAVCPKCSGSIEYDEFKIETGLSNIR